MNSLSKKNEDALLVLSSPVTENEQVKGAIKEVKIKMETPLMRCFDLLDDVLTWSTKFRQPS